MAPNKLECKFKEDKPGQILLTDITYLAYDLNKRAYLLSIKDSLTNEILAYKVSKSMDMRFIEETLNQLSYIKLEKMH